MMVVGGGAWSQGQITPWEQLGKACQLVSTAVLLQIGRRQWYRAMERRNEEAVSTDLRAGHGVQVGEVLEITMSTTSTSANSSANIIETTNQPIKLPTPTMQGGVAGCGIVGGGSGNELQLGTAAPTVS